MSRLLMLDTNTASYIIKRTWPNVLERLLRAKGDRLIISAVSEGELLFGARKIGANRIETGIRALLQRIEVKAWDSAAAGVYATLRVQQEKIGKPLGALDMLIAAHAVALGATLVSADAAFKSVTGLSLEDWTQP